MNKDATLIFPKDLSLEDKGSRDSRKVQAGFDSSFSSIKQDLLDGLRGLKSVDRYEVRRELGRGSSGVVYLGWDPLIKRNVAIKISRPSSDESRKAFFIEAQSAGKLNHPNIISIYDTNLFQNYCYLVMEYIAGEPLNRFCSPNNLLPVRQVIGIIDSACKALDYAHNEGVIHKDIKPSNIMLDKVGAVKITDFSIAQTMEESAVKNNQVSGGSSTGRSDNSSLIHLVGTPSYMSPEQLRQRVVGRESDIFSLGCVLYELLTGIKAFSGESLMAIAYKIMQEDPPPVSSLVPELPEDFNEVVRVALAKDPGKRFLNCNDLALSLKAAGQKIESETTEAADFFDFVHTASFFRSFTKSQVRELVTASNVIRVAPGKVIIRQGELEDVFYILLSGTVAIQKKGQKVAAISPGECFGEMAYLASQPRSADVVAETSCSLLKIKAGLLNKSSEAVQLLFFRRFAKILARRLGSA